MKQVKIIVFNEQELVNHTYGWTNESIKGYDACFNEIKKKQSNEINTIMSVGGGEHILFALSHFNNIKFINHFEISQYDLLIALLKLTVIKDYDFDIFISLLNGCINIDFIHDILKKSVFNTVINEMFKCDYDVALRSANNSGLSNDNFDFYTNKKIFSKLKNVLQNIDAYHIYLGDIFKIKNSQIVNKNKNSIVLLSNAYNGPKQKISNEFECKFMVHTLNGLTDCKKITSFNNWTYYVKECK